MYLYGVPGRGERGSVGVRGGGGECRGVVRGGGGQQVIRSKHCLSLKLFSPENNLSQKLECL